jgi:hypothetical protein
LDDSSLCRIFSAVAAEARRTLPLVCRRWRSLCDGTPSVWDHVHLDFSHGLLAGSVLSSRMYKWLVKRRAGVERLTIVAEMGAAGRRRRWPPAGLCHSSAARRWRRPLVICLLLPRARVPAGEDWMCVHLVLGLLAGTLRHLVIKGGPDG